MRKLLLTFVACLATLAAHASIDVFFLNDKNWANVYVHYWGSSETKWPGNKVTTTVTANGTQYYKATVPDGLTGIIFDAGNGQPQTVNLTDFKNGSVFSCSKNGQGTAGSGSIDAIGTITESGGVYTFTPAGQVQLTPGHLYFPVDALPDAFKTASKVCFYTWAPQLTDDWAGSVLTKQKINGNDFFVFTIDDVRKLNGAQPGGIQINTGGNPTQLEYTQAITLQDNQVINIYRGVVANSPESYVPDGYVPPTWLDWYVKLKGDFNNWENNNEVQLKSESEGIAVFNNIAINSPGSKFRIDCWTGSEDLYFGTGTQVEANGQPIQLPKESNEANVMTIKGANSTTTFNFRFDANNNELTITLASGELTQEDAIPTLYVVGANINGNEEWVAGTDNEMTYNESSKTFTWSGTTLGSSFKINNGDWNEYNIGAPKEGDNVLKLGNAFTVANNSDSQNISLGVYPSIVNPQVTLSLENNTLTVTGQYGYPESMYILGNIDGSKFVPESATAMESQDKKTGLFSLEVNITSDSQDPNYGYVQFATQKAPAASDDPWNQMGIRLGASEKDLQVTVDSDTKSATYPLTANDNSFKVPVGDYYVEVNYTNSVPQVTFTEKAEITDGNTAYLGITNDNTWPEEPNMNYALTGQGDFDSNGKMWTSYVGTFTIQPNQSFNIWYPSNVALDDDIKSFTPMGPSPQLPNTKVYFYSNEKTLNLSLTPSFTAFWTLGNEEALSVKVTLDMKTQKVTLECESDITIEPNPEIPGDELNLYATSTASLYTAYNPSANDIEFSYNQNDGCYYGELTIANTGNVGRGFRFYTGEKAGSAVNYYGSTVEMGYNMSFTSTEQVLSIKMKENPLDMDGDALWGFGFGLKNKDGYLGGETSGVTAYVKVNTTDLTVEISLSPFEQEEGDVTYAFNGQLSDFDFNVEGNIASWVGVLKPEAFVIEKKVNGNVVETYKSNAEGVGNQITYFGNYTGTADGGNDWVISAVVVNGEGSPLALSFNTETLVLTVSTGVTADAGSDKTEQSGSVTDNKTISIVSENPAVLVFLDVPAEATAVYYQLSDVSSQKRASRYAAPEGYQEATLYDGEGPDNDRYCVSLTTGTSGKLSVIYEIDGAQSKPQVYNFTVTQSVPTGIDGIAADEEGDEYFSLDGVKVKNPEKGIYIRVRNGVVTKVVK